MNVSFPRLSFPERLKCTTTKGASLSGWWSVEWNRIFWTCSIECTKKSGSFQALNFTRTSSPMDQISRGWIIFHFTRQTTYDSAHTAFLVSHWEFFLPVAISGPTKITILLCIYWCAMLSYPSQHWTSQLKRIINLSEAFLLLENSFWIIVDPNRSCLEHFQFFQLCLFLFGAFDCCGIFQRHGCYSMANSSLKAQNVFTKLPEEIYRTYENDHTCFRR